MSKENAGICLGDYRQLVPLLTEAERAADKERFYARFANSAKAEEPLDFLPLLIQFAKTDCTATLKKILFDMVVAWYSKKRPGVVWTTPEKACAVSLYNEFTAQGFDILGRPRQYVVPDEKGGMQIVDYPKDRDLLVNTYPQMKFLGNKR